MRMLKPGKWKIPERPAGRSAGPGRASSVPSVPWCTCRPSPRTKPCIWKNAPPGSPTGALSTITGPSSAAGLLKKEGTAPAGVLWRECHGHLHDASLPGSVPHAKLLVNYRGYGLSTGTPTEQNIMGDSLAILDSVLKETGRTPDDVILVGQSLGSGVATQIASVRNVKKLVLLVPFDSLLETARGLFPYLPVKLLLPDHFRSDLAAPKVACPVSILAAGSDEVIPPDHAKRLRDCFSTPVNYQGIPPAPCITPSGSAPALTRRSPGASATEPLHSTGARDTRRRHSPRAPAAARKFPPAARPETGWPIPQ